MIHPELEGGLQVTRHTLLQLAFPLREVRRYADTARRGHYDALVKAHGEHALLRDLLDTHELIDIAWRKVPPDSPLVGRTRGETAFRARTGATPVAIERKNELMVSPSTHTEFPAGTASARSETRSRWRRCSASWRLPEQTKLDFLLAFHDMHLLCFIRSPCFKHPVLVRAPHRSCGGEAGEMRGSVDGIQTGDA